MILLQRIRKAGRCVIPVLIFALTFSILSLASIPVSAATGNEQIAPDQPEYMQGDTAFIFGSGFEPNHQIVIQVIRVDNSIVTGNGTETPGSDIITSDPYGSFIYAYLLDGGPTSVYYGTLTVNAIDTVDMITVLATTTFLDHPNVGLQGCSRERGDCTYSSPSTGWADGTNPMNGWTSGNVKGWYELEDVPYRLRINPREPSDAKTYYITNEHDNLSSGVTGVDGASGFYFGAGHDAQGYTEGELTKTCVYQAVRLVGDNPTAGNPCIVTGPTYTGLDDDGDSSIDEDPVDGIDNDGDGKIDEDPVAQGSTGGTRRIQYTWAFLITSGEAGHDKKWALYWKAHLASGSSAFPGASLHAKTSASGSQDVPIQDVLALTGADLSIIKSDSPDPVTAGGALTYTITVTNNGPSTASNVVVTDTIPGGTTFVSATASQGSCSGTGTVTCSLGSLTNGASVTVTIVVTPNTAGTISNKASVSSSTSDPSSSNNTTPWIYTTVNSPPSNTSDLSISKTDSPDPVTAGGTLTYTITVTNAGPNTATNVTVTDTLPGSVSNISASGSGWTCNVSGYVVTCSLGSLNNNASATVTITVTAPSSGGTIINSASVSATQNDPDISDNTTSTSTTVTPSANLSITKTDSPDPVTASGILTYTITVTNLGPSLATNVTVTDTLPAGVSNVSATGTGWSCSSSTSSVTCTRGSLGVGSAPNISILLTVPAEGGSITNTAAVAATQNDPDSSNNTATASTMVNASADLSITKTDSPDPVTAGGTLTYTITVTNNGPSTAANLTVTDYLPPGVTYMSAGGTGWTCGYDLINHKVTCTHGSQTVGAAPAITLIVTAPASPGMIGNSATVSSSTSDPVSSNNTKMANTQVNASVDLSITKTDSPDPVSAGGTLTYTVIVTNNGPSPATNVTVTDTLPGSTTYGSATPSQGTCTGTATVTCNLGSLANGAFATVTITVTAPSTTGTINNSASVSGTESDPNTGNNSTGSVPTTVTASANLSITKSDSPDPVTAGGTVTYTITVTNNGPSPATNVTVTDTLSGSTTYGSSIPSQGSCTGTGPVICNLGSLANGASATVTITVTAPTEGGTIYNSASVSGSEFDPNTGNNSTGPVPTTVNASANLSITKTDSPDPVTAAGTLTYTLTVTNNGPSTATNVAITDTLPGSTTYGSATPSQGSCTGTTTVTCNLGSLANGASATVTITVTAPTEGGTISNNASVSGTEPDPNTGNNSTGPVPTTVTASANLSITKSDSPDPVTEGGTLSYMITVTNSGPSTATNVTVTDTLPGTTTYVSATPTQGSCSGTGTVTCNLGSLGNGASAMVTITVTPNAAGTIYNSAGVTLTENDPNTANNTTPAIPTTVNPPPSIDADLLIAKTDSPDPVTAGGTLTYTITVTNLGPNPATNLTVTDTLPSGVSNISAGGSGWTCGVAGYVVTCTRPSLSVTPPSAPDITITVTVPSSGGTIINTSSVTATENDPNGSNNTTGPVYTMVNASANLSITKGDSPDPVTVGGTLTYTITVTNNGPSPATNVTVTDTLPGTTTYVSATPSQGSCTGTAIVTCSLGSLANGANATVMVVVTPNTAGTISNSASVTLTENDPNTSDNITPAIATTVNPPPIIDADLSITKTDSPDPVALVGDPLTYTITVTNNGPATATGVTMTDSLPASVTLVSATPSQGPPCSGTTTITCNLGTLASGSSATVTVIVTTKPPAEMIGNTASVYGNETDPNMANNSVTATTNVGDVSRIIYLSTRSKVETGDNRMIGGFIVEGSLPKTLLIRARGPSMSGAPFNITGTLANPYLRLFSHVQGVYIAQNDNWADQSDTLCSSSGYVCGSDADILATAQDPCQPNEGQTVPPPNCSVESAILITVPPGKYSAIVSGVNNGTGVGLVQISDIDTSTLPKLSYISTRSHVLTGFDRMIGGFIIGSGNGSKKILIRARGPSMSGAPFNISGTLANPYIRLFSHDLGVYIAQNDNWGDQSDTLCASSGFACDSAAEITATGQDPCQPNEGQTNPPPNCNLESAILITVPPGRYSAVMSGVNNGTGVGLVQISDIIQ